MNKFYTNTIAAFVVIVSLLVLSSAVHAKDPAIFPGHTYTVKKNAFISANIAVMDRVMYLIKTNQSNAASDLIDKEMVMLYKPVTVWVLDVLYRPGYQIAVCIAKASNGQVQQSMWFRCYTRSLQ